MIMIIMRMMICFCLIGNILCCVYFDQASLRRILKDIGKHKIIIRYSFLIFSHCLSQLLLSSTFAEESVFNKSATVCVRACLSPCQMMMMMSTAMNVLAYIKLPIDWLSFFLQYLGAVLYYYHYHCYCYYHHNCSHLEWCSMFLSAVLFPLMEQPFRPLGESWSI